jgi:hypothetical protein
MPDQEPDLTPEQEQEVRRLLADARHDEPMPTEVAARLDRVLSDLAAEPGGGVSDEEQAASVVALASRRRRRVTSVLVAAAAVVAIGVGLGQLTDLGGSSSSDSAAERSTTSADSARTGAGSGAAKEDSPQPSTNGLASGAAPQMAFGNPVRIRPDHFSADVARARHLSDKSASYDARDLDSLETAGGKIDCTPADWGSGTFVPVIYDGHPGVLAFRPVNGDTQVADLFGCGSSKVLRSITLPAR